MRDNYLHIKSSLLMPINACLHALRLVTIIFTNLPSLHPLSFHEMIFILVPPGFLERTATQQHPFVRNSATKNVITGPRPAGHTYLKKHVSQSEDGVSFKAIVDSLIFCLAITL